MELQVPAVAAGSPDTPDPAWQSLYRVGGAAALTMAAIVIVQMIVFVAWPPPGNVTGWFTLFQRDRLIGLLDLDLLLIVDSVLMIPLYLALYVALRRTGESYMLLGTALGLVALTAHFASNPAFNMLALSDQYAVATTDAQRSLVLAAGQAVLSMWNGTAFDVYYVLGSIAPVIICAVMLRSHIFGKMTAYLGIVANVIALGLFVPSIGIYLSLLSIVVLEAWFILVGRRLWAAGTGR